MKLNLGCGDDRRDGYVNVDLRADVADVVADVTDLPYGDGSAAEIVAFDILEHFPVTMVAGVLAEWWRVLRPLCRLIVRVPNLRQLAKGLLREPEDDDTHRTLIRKIYGGHRWGPDGAWDTHHHGWTPRTLAADLKQAGFAVVSNDNELSMTVEAAKWP